VARESVYLFDEVFFTAKNRRKENKGLFSSNFTD
jgi:hypothetical protein